MMKNLITLNFESQTIREITDSNGQPWFVAKDVASILGYADTKRAIQQHCKRAKSLKSLGGTDSPPYMNQGVTLDHQTKLIPEGDIYRLVAKSTLPGAEKFESWLYDEVVPTIRETGSYPGTQPEPDSPTTLVPVAREVRAAVSIAKAFGLTGNQATLAANKAVRKITGVDPLATMELTHFTADDQSALLTVTEVGKRLNLSPRQVNPTLENLGFLKGYRDHKNRKCWELTDNGKKAGGVYLDTGKKHSDGTPVRQVKWGNQIVGTMQALVPELDPAYKTENLPPAGEQH